MPCHYIIDKDRRLVVTTVWDRLTFAEAKAHQDQLAGDPDFNPEFYQLIDATKVANWEMSLDEAKTIVGRRFFSLKSRRAVVAMSPALFGMGKLMEAFRHFRKDREQVAVFYDRNAALKWLGVDARETPNR